MQSIAVYGRLIVRAVLSEIGGELRSLPPPPSPPWTSSGQRIQPLRRSFHLVTAASGLSKTHSSLSSSYSSGSSSPSELLIDRHLSFGDDACFAARHRHTDVLGVADGVGGWRSYGVDPSLFPKSLMSVCERLIREGRFIPQQPVSILSASYQEIQQDKVPLIGSCTACIVAFHRENNTIYTANLGDSGFLVIRGGKVVHRSEEQQHYFNTPFQLAVAPTVLEGMVLSDSPESAQMSSFVVQAEDIILLGTDGLFDNMNDAMILQQISKMKDHRFEDMQEVANSLVNEAHKLAFDPTYLSPFAVSAAANGFNVIGGKPDDVTVLIACVAEGDPSTS